MNTFRPMALMFVSIAVFFSACNSEKDKTEQVAEEICNCMDKIANELSNETKKVFIEASKSNDPQLAITEQMDKLSDEERAKVDQEMNNMDNTQADRCFDEISKKYPELNNASEELIEKLMLEFEDECSDFSYALLKMSSMMENRQILQ